MSMSLSIKSQICLPAFPACFCVCLSRIVSLLSNRPFRTSARLTVCAFLSFDLRICTVYVVPLSIPIHLSICQAVNNPTTDQNQMRYICFFIIGWLLPPKVRMSHMPQTQEVSHLMRCWATMNTRSTRPTSSTMTLLAARLKRELAIDGMRTKAFLSYNKTQRTSAFV